MKKLIFLFLLVLSQVAYSQWEPCNTGLNGALIKSMVIKGNSIYIGVYGGGLGISTDMGESWAIKNSGMTNLEASCLLINGSDIFIGTSGGGVFLSTDNGENWIEQNNGLSNLKITSLATNKNKIFAGTDGNGIFISSDNGNNWIDENPSDSTDSKSYITTFAVNDDYIFAGTMSKGIFVSSDNGVNWTSGNVGLLNKDISNLGVYDNTIYAGTYGWLFSSTNNGKKWNSITIPKFYAAKVESFAVNDSMIVVASSTSFLFISSDYGSTWERKSLSHLPTSMAIIDKNIYVATIGGLMKSTDFGDSWTKKNEGLTNTVVNAIESVGNNIFVGTYGCGIFLSTNNGNSWKEMNNGFSTEHYRTSQVWSLAAKDGIIYTGTADDLYITKDSGNTWINKTKGKYGEGPMAFVVVDDKIFAGYFDFGVKLSTNNGDSWESKVNGLTDYTIYSLAYNGNYIFAGTFFDGVFVSSDYGENWIKNIGVLPPTVVYSLARSDNEIYAGFDLGLLYVTADNGENWKPMGITQNSVIGHIIYAIAIKDSLIFVGTNMGFYYSSNKGKTFSPKNDGLKTTYIKKIIIKGDTIFAGTYGGGMYRAKLSDFGITGVEDNIINKDNYLYTFPPFPNPATKEVRSLVFWDMSSDIEQDEIGIYNIYGAKVSDRSKITFDKLNLYSGYLIWNCAGIETGVYMIVIKHGTETRTIKVMVN